MNKETAPTTYNDSRFSYTLQREDGCKVKVQVSLSKELTQECYQAGFKNVKRHFSIPGFRKGRVPDSVIHERCAKQITEEYNRCITDTFFDLILPICKIYPHGQSIPKITALKPSIEEGATYQIEYETTAQVPEILPEQLLLKEISTETVDSDEVEKLYKKIAIRQGKKTEVLDRPIQKDDLVTVQYRHIYTSEKELEGEEEAREMTLYLNEITKDAEWLMPVLIGKNLNETVTTSMPSQNETPSPYLLKMQITNIETCESATDEQISEHFKGESKENIYKALEADLLKEIHKKEFEQKRRLVEEALLKTLSFDLPSSVIQKAAQKEIEYQQKLRKEDGEAFPSEERDRLFKTYQDLLSAQWKIDLLLSSFIEKETIEPSVQEITKAMLDVYLNESTFGNYLANPQQFQEEIKEKLKRRMAVEVIYERAQKESV